MTERLQRIHALLRAGHVPCALSSAPGAGWVLHAGNQDRGLWDVFVHDTDDELWVVDARRSTRLPDDATDAAIGDAVKLRIVQAWADQGNPEAAALISALQAPLRQQGSARRPTNLADPYFARGFVAHFLDPLQLAERMFDSANLLGIAFLRPTASVAVTVWSPWGTVQVGYTRQ